MSRWADQLWREIDDVQLHQEEHCCQEVAVPWQWLWQGCCCRCGDSRASTCWCSRMSLSLLKCCRHYVSAVVCPKISNPGCEWDVWRASGQIDAQASAGNLMLLLMCQWWAHRPHRWARRCHQMWRDNGLHAIAWNRCSPIEMRGVSAKDVGSFWAHTSPSWGARWWDFGAHRPPLEVQPRCFGLQVEVYK